MTKIIVTHHRPDLDALVSIWLLKRFDEGFEEAQVNFVPAGETFRGAPADDDSDVIHVDTGLGQFDHHQKKSFSCAASLCFSQISKKGKVESFDKKVLKRMIAQVTEIDNGREISWPEPTSDRYAFMLHNFIFVSSDDQASLEMALVSLDRIFQHLKNVVRAEEEIKKKGKEFETRWGKALGVRTSNDQVLTVGEKLGYVLVVKQDPQTGHTRIFARWDGKVDLRKAYTALKKADKWGTFYLHPSRCLILNGSRNNPRMVPTKLSLEKIMQIIGKS